jgi:hypothetical protein
VNVVVKLEHLVLGGAVPSQRIQTASCLVMKSLRTINCIRGTASRYHEGYFLELGDLEDVPDL